MMDEKFQELMNKGFDRYHVLFAVFSEVITEEPTEENILVISDIMHELNSGMEILSDLVAKMIGVILAYNLELMPVMLKLSQGSKTLEERVAAINPEMAGNWSDRL